jgi:hypothetical protein
MISVLEVLHQAIEERNLILSDQNMLCKNFRFDLSVLH